MSTKKFSLGKVLSITTGALVSENHIDGVYEILNHMTGQSVYTHQLGVAAEKCKPELLKEHPQLAGIDASGVNRNNWKGWLDALKSIHGNELEVTALTNWEYSDPIQSAIEMVGKDRVMVIKS